MTSCVFAHNLCKWSGGKYFKIFRPYKLLSILIHIDITKWQCHRYNYILDNDISVHTVPHTQWWVCCIAKSISRQWQLHLSEYMPVNKPHAALSPPLWTLGNPVSGASGSVWWGLCSASMVVPYSQVPQGGRTWRNRGWQVCMLYKVS